MNNNRPQETTLWLKLNQRNALIGGAVVTNPLRINFLCKKKVSPVCQSRTYPVVPEVAATLAKDRLIVVVDLLMANTTGIYWRCVRVGRIEDH